MNGNDFPLYLKPTRCDSVLAIMCTFSAVQFIMLTITNTDASVVRKQYSKITRPTEEFKICTSCSKLENWNGREWCSGSYSHTSLVYS